MKKFNIESSFQKTLKIIRLMDSALVSEKIIIKIHFESIESTNGESVTQRLNAIGNWLENYLNNSVFYNIHTEDNTELFDTLTNNLVMCPDEPFDYLVSLLIYSKLLAFCGDDIRIKNISFESNEHGFGQIISGDPTEILPTMSEWMGPRHFHDKPWWQRTDSSTVDMMPEPHEDLKKVPELGDELINVPSKSNVSAFPSQKKSTWTPKIITNDD